MLAPEAHLVRPLGHPRPRLRSRGLTPAARAGWPDEVAELRGELDGVLRSSALLAHLGGELEAWGPGWAEVRLPTAPPHANLAGTVHGAVITAAADAAFEAACNSWGRAAVAASIAVTFTAPASLGTVLAATAAEVSRARRTASYRIEVVDGDGVLVAWVQALAQRTSRWHLGEERWPAAWRERY